MRPTRARVCRTSLWLAFGVLGGIAAGCASQKAAQAPAAREMEATTAADAAPAEPTSPQAGTTEPTTLDEATRALDGAERALIDLFPRAPSEGAGPSPEAMASEGRCVDVCRALESMKRARDHVCKLAEGEPVRCTNANERVERAKARAVAACPTCS